mgnify:CR=1 FL=1
MDTLYFFGSLVFCCSFPFRVRRKSNDIIVVCNLFFDSSALASPDLDTKEAAFTESSQVCFVKMSVKAVNKASKTLNLVYAFSIFSGFMCQVRICYYCGRCILFDVASSQSNRINEPVMTIGRRFYKWQRNR